MSCVEPAGRKGFFLTLKTFRPADCVFNLISLCRLPLGSTPHEENSNQTVILSADWRIATQKSLFVSW